MRLEHTCLWSAVLSSVFLANALEETLAGTECELLIMRYGMKLPAEEVFALLEECRDLLAEKHGAPFSRKCWQGKVLDFVWHPGSPVHEAHPSLPQEHFA